MTTLFPEQEEAKAEASTSLAEFARQAWPILEPATPLKWNWHHDAICELLQAVTNGDIRDLLINVPPRCLKSILTSIFWPAWEWGPRGLPHTRWLTSSYAEGLAIDLAVKTRHLIRSPWYQVRWGQVFSFIGDQNQKTQYENDKTGSRIVASVGADPTGKGADRLVCDDPNRLQMVGQIITKETPEEREKAVQWWRTVMSTRRNDPKTSARVVIQQRVHERDVSGDIIADGNYIHLNLPMEFDPTHKCRVFLGGVEFWSDPREQPGQLLHEDRFGQQEIDAAKKDLGSLDYFAVFQQTPVPAGGNIIQLSWFRRYRERPAEFIRIIQSWDTANKTKAVNDPWACTTWGEAENGGYYLLDLFHDRMEYPRGKRMVTSLYEQWHPTAVLIEDKSSGQALVQELRQAVILNGAAHRIPVLAQEPESDKVTRMSVHSALIEAGLVWLPESAAWLPIFEHEMMTFPRCQHDDIVDSVSQALQYLRHRPVGEPRVRRL